MSTAALARYATQDALTDPGAFAGLYDDLPVDIPGLREIVSRSIVHVSWAARYGIPPGTPLPRETTPVADRLRLLQAASPGSLVAARPPHRRTFGTCRDFSLLLCSVLRQRAIPARIRCGFATYFTAAPHEDHWICEHWSSARSRWMRVDAQLDQMHREALGIAFDCADLPDTAYLSGAQAWRRVREGAAAADDFGHGDARGLWFLRVNLHRDLLALANRPMSAWDTWRSATAASRQLDEDDRAACDRAASAIEAVERAADEAVTLSAFADGIQVPPWHY